MQRDLRWNRQRRSPKVGDRAKWSMDSCTKVMNSIALMQRMLSNVFDAQSLHFQVWRAPALHVAGDIFSKNSKISNIGTAFRRASPSLMVIRGKQKSQIDKKNQYTLKHRQSCRCNSAASVDFLGSAERSPSSNAVPQRHMTHLIIWIPSYFSIQ